MDPMPFLAGHLALLPILIPFAGALVGLLFKNHPFLRARWSLGVMGLSLAASILLLVRVFTRHAPVVCQAGGWPAPFGITFIADPLSALFVFMSQTVLFFGVLYALGCKDRCMAYPGFFPLFLFLATGLTGGLLTGDLFNLFVFAELMVLSSAVLTAVSDHPLGTEAAYKYFFISQLAAVSLLMGIGALYTAHGTLNMAQLARFIAEYPDTPMTLAGMALLTTAFLIKSAAMPFHFWQPDFHNVAPTPVSAMLSSVVVKFGVYGFIRMTTLLFAETAAPLEAVLTAAGLTGVIFGGVAAVGTHDTKRMLAYSTIAQVGFILAAMGWGTPAGMAAALVFAVNHSLLKSAMLMLAGYVASRASIKSAAFEVVTGVGKSLPLAGVLFFLGGLGLAGIPPTNGFVSKLLIFRSGISAAKPFALVCMGLAGMITLVYTTRAFQRIWWLEPAEGIWTKPAGDRLMAPLILIALVMILGLHPDPLVRFALETARWLETPGEYIRAVLGG